MPACCQDAFNHRVSAQMNKEKNPHIDVNVIGPDQSAHRWEHGLLLHGLLLNGLTSPTFGR